MTIFSLQIFGLTIAPSYYGLMYALGFLIGYYILSKRKIFSVISTEAKRSGEISIKDISTSSIGQNNKLDDLFLYIFLGVILGGRIGYILFYDMSYYSNNLLDIIKIWQGGMSFHGGAMGVIIAMFLFSRKYKFNFLKLADEITRVLPIGLFLGRIGNYLNKELLGFQYTGFLAVEKNGNYYFPSPLLEAFLEGIVLFIILFFVNKHKKIDGIVASLFLIIYAIFRIFVEIFFRVPDPQIGYIFGFLTMGSFLSFIMLLAGIISLFIIRKKYATKYFK